MLAHGREVHGAKNNERHVCGRPRDVSGPCLVSAQCVLKPVSRQRLTHRAATKKPPFTRMSTDCARTCRWQPSEHPQGVS